jgi:hypothetical protein
VIAGATALVTTPTSPWVPAGFSESGVTLTVDRKVDEIRAEEQSTPVLVVPDTTDVTVDITFIEDVLANAALAYGGSTITTVAATSSLPATTTLTLAESLTQYAIAAVGVNSFGFARLLYIPDVYSGGKVKTSYRRTKTPRSYPTTFTAACALAQIAITDATAVET